MKPYEVNLTARKILFAVFVVFMFMRCMDITFATKMGYILALSLLISIFALFMILFTMYSKTCTRYEIIKSIAIKNFEDPHPNINLRFITLIFEGLFFFSFLVFHKIFIEFFIEGDGGFGFFIYLSIMLSFFIFWLLSMNAEVISLKQKEKNLKDVKFLFGDKIDELSITILILIVLFLLYFYIFI